MKIKLFLLLCYFPLAFSFSSPIRNIFRKTKYCIRKKSKNIQKYSSLVNNLYKTKNYDKKIRVNTKKQIKTIKKDLYKESNVNLNIVFLEQFCLAIDDLKIINDIDKEIIKLSVSSLINKKVYFNIPIKNIIISFSFHSIFSHTIYKVKICIINSTLYNSPEFQYIIHIFNSN